MGCRSYGLSELWVVGVMGRRNRDLGPVSQKFVRTILLYEFVKPVLNYRSNEFVALTNLCETGPRPPCRISPGSGS